MSAADDLHPRELLPGHLLGILDPSERARVERHLGAGCAACADELARLERDLGLLGEAVPAVEPTAELRARVLAAARRRRAGGPDAALRPSRPVRARPAWSALLAAALAVVVLGGALWTASHYRARAARLVAERDELRRELAEARQRLERDALERLELARLLEWVAAPQVKQISLAALDAGRSASGRTFVDPDRGAALFVAQGLSPLPADRTYQLWYIADGKPVSAGTFAIGASGVAELRVANVPGGGVEAWAVTIEPAGGVPQPTGPMVLKG